MKKKLQLYEPFCGSKSRRLLSNKRRTRIAFAIKFDNVSRAIMDDGTKESARILLHIQSPSVTIERLTRNDLKRLTRQKRAGRFTFQVRQEYQTRG